MTVGQAHRRDRRVDHVHAGIDGLHQRRGGKPRGGVTVDRQRDFAALLDARDHFLRGVGMQQAGHVLDADRMAAHVLEFLRHVDPEVDAVHRADRVRHGPLGVPVDRDGGLDRGFDVAHVVHRVEDAEHVHAVFGAALDEFFDHVVGVVPVAERVLAAQQHLHRRVGHRRLELAQAFPRVFAEIADTGIEDGAAPGFERPETDLVQFCRDRQHVLDAHPRREQGLRCVAQDQVGNLQGFGHVIFPCSGVGEGPRRLPRRVRG